MNPDHIAPATYRDDTVAVPPVTVAVANPATSVWERALNVVKNVFVIITCIALLAALYRAHQAAAAFGEFLDAVGKSLSGFGA